MKEKIYQYILMLGDNSMILGHRLSELCGRGPSLETDMALTNISLDLFGQVRNYFQYAAELKGDNEITENSIAFLRYPHEYKNVLLVEQPNTDFAHIICRQFFYDAFHLLFLEKLMYSNDTQLAAIAAKSIKEVKYHFRFSSNWVIRLGDGSPESHERMQKAVDYLWSYIGEFFENTPLDNEMHSLGIAPDLEDIKVAFYPKINEVLKEATLIIPESTYAHSGGKKGIHTEHMGFILSDLQYMQRAYPKMEW